MWRKEAGRRQGGGEDKEGGEARKERGRGRPLERMTEMVSSYVVCGVNISTALYQFFNKIIFAF